MAELSGFVAEVVVGAPDGYELARPVRVVFRLSEAEAEKLRQVCFEQRVTMQAFVIGLLANAGICEM